MKKDIEYDDMKAKIERLVAENAWLRADSSYQVAAGWRDKFRSAEAEINRLRADNDRLYAAIREILASPPAGISNAVVSEIEKGA